MRMLIVAAGCAAVILGGCRSEEAAPPAQIEMTDTSGTMMSDTITPGTTERAATATSTVAPTPLTRTTTSAPPGATARRPAAGTATSPPPPADAAPASTAQIIDGRSVFQARCVSCHGAAGERAVGGRALRGSAVQRMAQGEIERRIRDNAAHRAITLSAADLRQVAAYVKALN